MEPYTFTQLRDPMACCVYKLKYRKIHGERNRDACVDIEKKTTDGFENGLGWMRS